MRTEPVCAPMDFSNDVVQVFCNSDSGFNEGLVPSEAFSIPLLGPPRHGRRVDVDATVVYNAQAIFDDELLTNRICFISVYWGVQNIGYHKRFTHCLPFFDDG